MLKWILIFTFHLSFASMFAQTEVNKIETLTLELTRLKAELTLVNSRYITLQDSIRLIESKLGQEKLNELTTKGFICMTQTNSDANVRNKPGVNGAIVFSIPKKSNLKVLEYMGESYWKIQYNRLHLSVKS